MGLASSPFQPSTLCSILFFSYSFNLHHSRQLLAPFDTLRPLRISLYICVFIAIQPSPLPSLFFSISLFPPIHPYHCETTITQPNQPCSLNCGRVCAADSTVLE
ncbi:hypothetical protein BOTBODRAFT_557651 [Botryobasidium botryosum FD-172 SS1]|uniref:Uncharacterized protein n=1 Tax=Botryobasidium botryosum (strain FD-172 SS1) TaxID=930990 RepID=A0A067MA65_BOTB1|nr:hypothetical protein BOTBODRAFT_557651 [Botryobasidium botryosum FD-172 SS1]